MWSLGETGSTASEEPAGRTRARGGEHRDAQRRYCAVRWGQGEMLVRGSRRDKKAHSLERRQL